MGTPRRRENGYGALRFDRRGVISGQYYCPTRHRVPGRGWRWRPKRSLLGSTVRREGSAISAYAPPAAARPRSRGPWARVGRARLVAVEAAAGAAFGGAVLRGPLGWTVLTLAGLALLVAVARRDGRWVTDLLAARLRGTAA